ncbi:DNA-binding response OmpR family regulator [Actimicrobium sp. GrIS 1.19]|uniref:response regulator transcription factor n=1 Tax=Actimicrobium sp. GrIS 1.19 TaxID=3071708 RepID=UPI002DF9940E|nr:DNA-binding response OmpR family regulator [Actimicrobium sp. GrIS 1.19]
MIEDDERLSGMVAAYLRPHGFEVRHAASAQAGMAMLRQGGADFALVLLDLMLPDADGLEVCRQIRTLAAPLRSIPVVMLTAKGDPFDRVIGLEIGADDYIPKPFEPRELLARLRAVLRRPPLASEQPQTLRFGHLEIDPGARSVRLAGEARALTSYQFDLLVALAGRAGRVLSREQLLDAVKGQAFDPFDRSIDVHIGRLRAAIEDDARQSRRIITIRGAGYVFAAAHD